MTRMSSPSAVDDFRDGVSAQMATTLGREAFDPAASHSREMDMKIVTWSGPDDPDNPKNWSLGKKWVTVAIVSTFTLMSAAASSIVAPAETEIAQDLHISSTFTLNLIFSIFLLGYVAGPLLLAPLSELYGRAIILRYSNIFFSAFCLGSGFAQTSGQLIACRFLAGLGACAPQTVGGGVLSDCFDAEERGKALVLYSLAPVLGPSIAPLVGGFIAASIGWRWTFWILTIMGAAVTMALFFGLRETYPFRILTLKARQLRKETGDQSIKSQFEADSKGVWPTTKTALTRPLILIVTQPIVQFLALYQAIIYGLIFLMLSTFPGVWTNKYNQSVQIGGLNYIAIAIGMMAGAQTGGLLLDRIYRHLKAKSHSKEGRPEYRIPMLVPGILLIAAGLILYGWTAEYRVQWIVPDIGAAIFAFGAFSTFAIPQSYIIDAYPTYAASAIGVTAIARSLAGFGFPLFADSMFDALGYGWGNSVLALGAVLVGLPGTAVLWFYGEKLRRLSPYAAG